MKQITIILSQSELDARMKQIVDTDTGMVSYELRLGDEPTETKIDAAVRILKENPGLRRIDYMKMFMDQLGMVQVTANTYYYKAKEALQSSQKESVPA